MVREAILRRGISVVGIPRHFAACAGKRLASLMIIVSTLAAPAGAAPVPFNTSVETRIQPQAERLLKDLTREGRALKIDGVPVFNGDDKFLPGKIALGLADFIASLPKDDPRLPLYLGAFRKIAKMTTDDPNDSWGIYYYLSALDKFRRAGWLAQAVDPLTLAKLRVRLDWRSFVDVDSYALIDHPNNFYCVAFSIARLRAAMGWDGQGPVDRLYKEMVDHYRQYSGAYGFADETNGEGRFDRYSVLLAGEIAARFVQTGDRPPAEVLGWLRKSADVMLMRVNPEGRGFEYGRSIGPYGETSMIEVLTAAAALDLLDPREKALAYAYASAAADRYVHFWMDPRTGSVNLWDGGRRTDAYRGKFRILGENLSLAHQYVYTNAIWNALGYKDRPPAADWQLSRLPVRATTWFAKGRYDRLLVTMHDRGRLVALPIINGGAGQHDHSPYFPIPFSPGMLAGVADGNAPLLVPQLTLADGSKLMPLSFERDVRVISEGKRTRVVIRQTELDRIGKDAPEADSRVTVETDYLFEPGRITRTDIFTPKPGTAITDVAVEFASFSPGPTQSGSVMRFASGAVSRFAASGFAHCAVHSTSSADTDYQSPEGAMASVVRCSGLRSIRDTPFTLTWRIEYQ